MYLITGLPNGTYNISYSQPGFNTAYLEVTITGSDRTNQNKTIDDTTPPGQVTGLNRYPDPDNSKPELDRGS